MQTDTAHEAPLNTCLNCGQSASAAHTYTCYLGKRTFAPESLSRSSRSTAARFFLKGSRQEALCDKCVVRSGWFTVLRAAILTAVCIALFIFSYMSTGGGSGLAAAVSIIAGLVGVFSFAVAVWKLVLLAMKKYAGFGTALLIELCKKEYHSDDIDTFWTPAEYQKLSARKN